MIDKRNNNVSKRKTFLSKYRSQQYLFIIGDRFNGNKIM